MARSRSAKPEGIAARGRGVWIRIGTILCAGAVCLAAGGPGTPAARAFPIPPPPPPSCLGSFGYTGHEVACAVPPGITALHIVATGGSGDRGGLAGAVRLDLPGVSGGDDSSST